MQDSGDSQAYRDRLLRWRRQRLWRVRWVAIGRRRRPHLLLRLLLQRLLLPWGHLRSLLLLHLLLVVLLLHLRLLLHPCFQARLPHLLLRQQRRLLLLLP